MIYTITFNPSIDYIMNLESFSNNSINRASSEYVNCGGKGINVSSVLTNLKLETTALGFISGFTGEYIEKTLFKEGMKTDFIKLKDGISRINVKLKSETETEINGNGPIISQEDINKLIDKIKLLKEDDILVLAGSIPSSLPKNTYETIISTLENKKIKFVVDATGELILNTLKYKPFLIKPNNHELEEIFKTKIISEEQLILNAKKLQLMGAQNVLISLAKDGAILIDQNQNVYKSSAPKGNLVNSVGAGDSMVAGFIYGYLKYKNLEDALKFGISAGTATAFTQYLATKNDIYSMYKKL
ncbi:MAG: 1-phosphofructokinase [Oscillospiraceae bacterium]|nr:1-phosphofructokinase [Oscillospiraceae bacterium]